MKPVDAKSVKVESLAVIRVAVDWENRRIFAPSKNKDDNQKQEK